MWGAVFIPPDGLRSRWSNRWEMAAAGPLPSWVGTAISGAFPGPSASRPQQRVAIGVGGKPQAEGTEPGGRSACSGGDLADKHDIEELIPVSKRQHALRPQSKITRLAARHLILSCAKHSTECYQSLLYASAYINIQLLGTESNCRPETC
jgi:hypothetical protein